jgi:hypothetical protein
LSIELFEGEAFDMRFIGIREPDEDVPLIEVERSDGTVVDLYNENWLRSVVVCGDELTFNFVKADPVNTTSLRFLGFRNLRVVQPRGWAEGEADQMEHLLFRSSGPWRRIVFKAGGLDYEFDCAELRVDFTGNNG